MGYRLIIKNRDLGEEDEPEVKEFDQEIITMGRHSTNDVQIAHPGSSRQHCKIILEDGNYFLFDPGSANGTLLNGRKIPLKRNQLLKDDDLIGVESYDIRFKTMDRVAVKGPGENTDEVALRVVREVLGALQAKSNPYVEVVAGYNKGKIVEFSKDVQQIIMGRSETCEVPLNDSMISRRNSKIRRDWSGITIFDMNSKNGTYVNGVKIKEHQLKDGDEIQLGECKLIFHNPKESFHREMEVQDFVPEQGESSKPLVTVSHGAIERSIEDSKPPPPLGNQMVRNQGVFSEDLDDVPESGLQSLLKKFSPMEIAAILTGVVVIIIGLVVILKLI